MGHTYKDRRGEPRHDKSPRPQPRRSSAKITNVTEYDDAVAELDELLDLDPPVGSEDHTRLIELSDLIEQFDDMYYNL